MCVVLEGVLEEWVELHCGHAGFESSTRVQHIKTIKNITRNARLLYFFLVRK